jgi:CMP-N-acetylneuraminic acid synthetase
MSILSLVTIREGSKGLKNKCLRKIRGKAVFIYTVEYSIDLEHRIGERVFTAVSSDAEIVRSYCSKNGIRFLQRSPQLASDTARIEDVIYEAYREIGDDFDYISLLYGNYPIRYPEEFLKAYHFLQENESYDAVLSMQNVGKFNPAWMFDLTEDILPFKKSEGYRRQDLKQLMIHDGHTILFRTKHFLEFMESNLERNIMYQVFGSKIKPVLNDKLIIDIDTEKDLKLAEAVLMRKQNEGGQNKGKDS